MSDETKNGDESKEKPEKGESAESVTKIEKRTSQPPEKDEKKALQDDSPTGAQTPIAKAKSDEPPKPKRDDGPKKPKVVVKDDDDDEDERPAVKRPAPTPRKDSATESRRTRASGESVGLLVVVGGALVLGNLAMMGASQFRVDATKEERFSLSKKGTAHLLSTCLLYTSRCV